LGKIRAGFLIAFFLSNGVLAWAKNEYISTASIFELEVSARVAGLGGAFIALADDEAATFYNPAGLPFLSQSTLTSHFTRPFGLFFYGTAGTAGKGWGGYLLLLDSDPLEERDLYGNPIGTFRYTSLGLIFGVGFRSTERLSFGLQIKAYALALPTQAVGLSFSPSLLFQDGARTYGIVWRNLISTPIQFINGHTESWISDIAAGIAWRFGTETLVIDFTENLIARGDISCVRIGCESKRFYPLVLRAGTNREGTSLGFSLFWGDLRIDFAYLLHFVLPDTYMASFSYKWKSF
jgi:hypothetical protein